MTCPSCTLICVPSPAAAPVSPKLRNRPDRGRDQRAQPPRLPFPPPSTTSREGLRSLAEHIRILPRHVVAPIPPGCHFGILFDRGQIRRLLRAAQHTVHRPARRPNHGADHRRGSCRLQVRRHQREPVLDPAITHCVLMPDPKVRETNRPCQLRIVTRDDAGYLPSDVEMGSYDEAERACDAANARMGWTRAEVDRIVLASMGGGTA